MSARAPEPASDRPLDPESPVAEPKSPIPGAGERIRALLFVVVASFCLQLRQMRGNADWMMPLITTPLLTIVFVTIFLHAGRLELVSYAVLAPAMMAMWSTSLMSAGELISSERENGSLEGLIAAPAPFGLVLFGRIAAVTTLSLAGFAEAWVTGSLLIGEPVPIAQPWHFSAAVLVTVLAMTCWAGVMSSLFVLARSARIFQNSLSYPFFVLGGVLVPVSMLPVWVEVPSRLVFLSWSSDLLRDSMAPVAVDDLLLRLGTITLLGLIGLGLSLFLLDRTLKRVRTTGRLTHA
ncbi:ABC transporter permease [Nesterenkonia muleiensis]|uniref:ABC transporter permease n=1 Tax=Nesterenkonia muleiensis TaxID=2282648 RepID=UPI000E767EAA|nr:ABC transporter permease [Nesterenkonia muleiensis]